MRYLLFILTIASIQLFADIDFMPKTVSVSLNKSYVPIGFDDNDRVQFAVEGEFHNTCFKVGPYAVKINQADKTVFVHQQAYQYSGICLQMFVPFTQVVDLGILESGNYRIKDMMTGKELGTLPINHATNPNQDDFLYAPITDAYVLTDPDTKKSQLVCSGSFSDRCTDFEEIKIGYQENVLVVQPVVRHSDVRNCPKDKVRFLKTIDLKEGIHGVHLLHVRSMNGQAINKMVDLP